MTCSTILIRVAQSDDRERFSFRRDSVPNERVGIAGYHNAFLMPGLRRTRVNPTDMLPVLRRFAHNFRFQPKRCVVVRTFRKLHVNFAKFVSVFVQMHFIFRKLIIGLSGDFCESSRQPVCYFLIRVRNYIQMLISSPRYVIRWQSASG